MSPRKPTFLVEFYLDAENVEEAHTIAALMADTGLEFTDYVSRPSVQYSDASKPALADTSGRWQVDLIEVPGGPIGFSRQSPKTAVVQEVRAIAGKSYNEAREIVGVVERFHPVKLVDGVNEDYADEIVARLSAVGAVGRRTYIPTRAEVKRMAAELQSYLKELKSGNQDGNP